MRARAREGDRPSARDAARNGDAPEVEAAVDDPTPPLVGPLAVESRRCRRCGQTKAVAEFPTGRATCRACKAARNRERRAAARVAGEPEAEEPRRPRTLDRGYTLVPRSEVVDAEARRSLLAGLRANGVEFEERDGREFTVIRLPSVEPEVVTIEPRVEPR